MTTQAYEFYALAALALATALAMVTARNVVHAVLFMAGNLAVTAALYLTLHAPFLAVVQVAVYAGAIMVLFLFAVMLLGHHEADLTEPVAHVRALGLPLVALLAVLLTAAVRQGVPPPRAAAGAAPPAAAQPPAADFGSAQAIGDTLFRDHVLSFEVVGVLLLVAVLGAVVIAHYRAPAPVDPGAGGMGEADPGAGGMGDAVPGAGGPDGGSPGDGAPRNGGRP